MQVLKRSFTVAQYHQMAEAGIFTPDERIELIEGEVITVAAIGFRHAACVDRAAQLFFRKFGDKAIVRVQNPVQLGDRSEPQPDIALLHPKADFYATQHPTAADIFLIVEVADSSLEYDRQVRVPLYAQQNVIEVWLIDIEHSALSVYQQPLSGKYQTVKAYGCDQCDQSLSCLAFPEISIAMADLLN
ncbi:Uma2 family endonuclease [Sphaerothrix gracilis]|uniref:Uma2 family endonuclease n=1 Tax=Sphaerothrix gracilis TaxID=3151835 RepID=UPI0031FE0013